MVVLECCSCHLVARTWGKWGLQVSKPSWVESPRSIVHSYSLILFPPDTSPLFSFSVSFSTFYCSNIKKKTGLSRYFY